MNARLISSLMVFVSLFFSGRALFAEDFDWYVIGRGQQANISGMALIERSSRQTSFLVVHDNKKKKQGRAGIVIIKSDNTSEFLPLGWPGDDAPVDLEALTKVPETTRSFMAFTSAGKVYQIELDEDKKSLRVIKSFPVPHIPRNGNFEGFSLQRVGSGYLAVWAERGENKKPATLFWSNFDLQTGAFTKVGSIAVKVPYPTNHVRHISDLKVDANGRVFISSAADPGNNGPFASAVYLAGTFDLTNQSSFTFYPSSSLTRLFAVDNRKIEAFELLPDANGAMAYGTDDENLGSAVYLGRLK